MVLHVPLYTAQKITHFLLKETEGYGMGWVNNLVGTTPLPGVLLCWWHKWTARYVDGKVLEAWDTRLIPLPLGQAKPTQQRGLPTCLFCVVACGPGLAKPATCFTCLSAPVASISTYTTEGLYCSFLALAIVCSTLKSSHRIGYLYIYEICSKLTK